MLNGLVIIAILLIFFGYEVLLGLSRFLSPVRAFAWNERLFKRVAHQIFNLMGTYRKVSLAFENRSGRELPERFLLISNHQSLMDIPAFIELVSGRNLRFVAKRELGKGFPFVSNILRTQGHALVERDGDASQAMRAILRFTRRCEKECTCPVIFPEGTRSRDGDLGIFHTAGVRKILTETPLPVVVAVIDGGWRIAGARAMLRNLRGVRFRVRVLSVSQPLSAKKEVLEGIARAHDDIELGLATMRKEEALLQSPAQ
jgi:1-acyl-sn-glycerol-3-phosphate acyltransferase